jgi:hypothetical protein
MVEGLRPRRRASPAMAGTAEVWGPIGRSPRLEWRRRFAFGDEEEEAEERA